MTTTTDKYYQYKPKSVHMTEKYYRDSVEQAASYNKLLLIDKKMRLPFLDSQTGVAQNHSQIWMPYQFRMPGNLPTQLYSYPAKRWRKKKRAFLYNTDFRKVAKESELETGEADMHEISAVENPAATMKQEVEPREDIVSEASRDKWYDDFDTLSEPPDAGEIDQRNSDSSDYEEMYVKRRKKKTKPKKSTSRSRKNADKDREIDEKEKPYSCDTCGARYKTRPGLTYHLTHAHNLDDTTDEGGATPTESKVSTPTQNGPAPSKPKSTDENGKPNPNNYCDFCLGDETENKKTGVQEELVSCADCGRSGHPSCLQFTANMIISVKKYPWQCIECKSCGLCGTSDNDDQLLFCDDCDRGYHMYCLNPPLSEPPEGSWSCHLCIEEFYDGKKPEGMQ